MSRRTLGVLTVLGLVSAAVIATVVVLTFGGSVATEQPGTDAGYAINPIGTEPADVAVAVMSGIFTWQPAVQDSSWEALHSQQDRVTGAMAAAAAQRPSPAPQPLPEWAAWARSGDTITAVVRPEGGVAVDGDTALVPVTITQTIQHRHGDATPYYTYAAAVTMSKESGTWKVEDYRLTRNVR